MRARGNGTRPDGAVEKSCWSGRWNRSLNGLKIELCFWAARRLASESPRKCRIRAFQGICPLGNCHRKFPPVFGRLPAEPTLEARLCRDCPERPEPICCEVSLPHPTRWQVYFCRKWAQDSGFETCVKKSATWRWRGIFPASGGRRREIGIPGRSGSGLPGAERERSGRAGSPGPFPEKRGNRRRPFD